MIIKSHYCFFTFVFGITLLHAQSTEALEAQPQEIITQNCMEIIDVSENERLSKQLELFDAQIAILCQAGNYNQAKAKADLFAQQMLTDKTIQQWLACNRKLSELLSGKVAARMEFLQSDQQAEYTGPDVCDNLRQDSRKPRQWTIWP